MQQKREIPGPFNEKVVEVLREKIDEYGLTQSDAGEAAGIDRGRMSRLMNLKNSLYLNTLAEICATLDLNVAEIVAEAERRMPQKKKAGANVPISWRVAEEIKDLAQEQGVSGVELARRSGVSQAQVARILTHERKISLEHLHKIANALGTSAPAVLARAEERVRA
ncbi:helix-turn-helix domain-containing protein [Actinotignum sanguinis]|uniref:helix-turn-helix domain-containing protein n=2 Tax=Actinotignum sanguinis TaxID=1445614 RepID=UPI00237D5A32|nr:helix-turn-helix transcriptional regulator [Actinotignum sanguinis]MDE1552255.1 helix-turn-helix transcriptional regulator [Actinotignum sanguinis]